MAYEREIQRYRSLYAQLLRLYPKPFYDRLGEGMEQTFCDVLKERAHTSRDIFSGALWMGIETSGSIINHYLTYNSMLKPALRVALVTAALLMIPVIGMQVSSGWNWTTSDFVFAAVLIFGTGFLFELARTKAGSSAYKYGAGTALLGAFLLIWINGAVGIIGNEENPINLLYLVAILIGIVGAFIARFRAHGMSRAMYAAAGAVALVPFIGLVMNPSVLVSSLPGVIGVLIINAFFVALFAGAGILFRRAA